MKPFDDVLKELRYYKPVYDYDSDYQTNSKSYYDYLARVSALMKILAKRVVEYDEELAKRFEEWDKLIEKFPENVENLLIQWLNDGTLEEMIRWGINEEVIKARTDLENNTFENLKERIDSEQEKINVFKDNIKIVEWKEMENHNEYIQNILNKKGHIHFSKGIYLIGDTGLQILDNTLITSDKDAIFKKIPTELSNYSMFEILEKENIIINGLNLFGDKFTHLSTLGEWGMGISVISSSNININYCNIHEFWGDGIYVGKKDGSIHKTENITINNNNTSNNSRNGISILDGNNINIYNNISNFNDRTAPKSGIDLEPNGNNEISNIKVYNNICTNQVHGIQNYKSKNVKIYDNILDNEKDGIYLGTDSQECYINDNTINNSEIGINLYFGGGNCVINNNIIKNVNQGINIYRSYGNDTIKNNIFYGKNESNDFCIKISGNYNFPSNNNIISNNRILNFDRGITEEHTPTNTFNNKLKIYDNEFLCNRNFINTNSKIEDIVEIKGNIFNQIEKDITNQQFKILSKILFKENTINGCGNVRIFSQTFIFINNFFNSDKNNNENILIVEKDSKGYFYNNIVPDEIEKSVINLPENYKIQNTLYIKDTI